MTYCVGVQVDEGLVFLSDSRTNAGVDHISTFRKMTIFEVPGERVLVLLSAGNLATSQSVTGLLRERVSHAKASLLTARTMSDAAQLVGHAVRDVYHRDAHALKEHGIEFNPTFIIGGQIGGTLGSYEASDGAEIYVARSTFSGIGRRFDTATMNDLGGNEYELEH